VAPIRRGTLLDGSAAPGEGEHHAPLAHGMMIEPIVSSERTPRLPTDEVARP
jgi:hypothetical protein